MCKVAITSFELNSLQFLPWTTGYPYSTSSAPQQHTQGRFDAGNERHFSHFVSLCLEENKRHLCPRPSSRQVPSLACSSAPTLSANPLPFAFLYPISPFTTKSSRLNSLCVPSLPL